MTNPFIQTTPAQLGEMLKACDASSIDELFDDQVPAELQFKGSHGLPAPLSELELQRELTALAAKNRPTTQVVSFLGGGIYDHFVPTAIMHVANRQEYVTGYTPYQPEASQGLLQAFFEYQSLISRLYEMPVSNASLYDGASALGEAIFLALGIRPERNKIVMPNTVHPEYRALAKTYLANFNAEIVPCGTMDGRIGLEVLDELIGPDTAAVIMQQPNYFGCIEEAQEVANRAHHAGALLIVIADPLSLGVLAPPGSYGADIAIGEGQPLGLNQFAGGESLGIFTCQKDFIRKVPGRLVGVARDRENRRGFVLTLQTREQHIRREKATSNICTNHAHNALRATIYMCLMGPQGLGRVARSCVRGLERLRSAIEAKAPGAIAFPGPNFRELTLMCKRPANEVRDAMLAKDFYAGIPLGETLGKQFANHLLVAVTEKPTDDEIDAFATALEQYL
ncbi:MAG: aminomethyl-transferring glycine dehydrogenase subunit GcvPA [Candidatus Sumerlaeaceae bacterium]